MEIVKGGSPELKLACRLCKAFTSRKSYLIHQKNRGEKINQSDMDYFDDVMKENRESFETNYAKAIRHNPQLKMQFKLFRQNTGKADELLALKNLGVKVEDRDIRYHTGLASHYKDEMNSVIGFLNNNGVNIPKYPCNDNEISDYMCCFDIIADSGNGRDEPKSI